MNKIKCGFFAVVMMFSLVFFSEAVSSSNSPFAVKAQQVSVKKRRPGIARSVARGGKYIYRKTGSGARYVYRKTAQGTVYVGKQVYKGGKWTFNKTKRGTKATVSRAKKILY
jgi:hypothetical protein